MQPSKRAAIYKRVSDPKQATGYSLDTQENACREYAQAHGYQVLEAHVYTEMHTGVELWERPELTRLREAIRRHELDVLICHDIDRFGRDPAHQIIVLQEAQHYEVEVEFVLTPLDNSPEGDLIRYVKGYAASVEWHSRQRRSTRGRVSIFGLFEPCCSWHVRQPPIMFVVVGPTCS